MSGKQLLLGDEALALGALDAGLSGVYAYPGTPSTEITEFIQAYGGPGIHNRWSSNEKTAMEAALGVSYSGKRALVCMKHVGMNVCADAFMGAAMTGANGGLVVASCDDPSMHSSQNEQDSRFYAHFAMVPLFEPANQQETYDMTREAFDLSEKYGIPVLLRLTTRMAHSRAVVQPSERREQNEKHFPPKEKERQWVLLPANAKVRNVQLIRDYEALKEESGKSVHNTLTDGRDHSMGIITCGIAANYLEENYPDGCPYPVLKVRQYPFPENKARELAAMTKTIIVIEEGQPMVEEAMIGMFPSGITIKGRLDGTLPRTGELSPDSVRAALALPALPVREKSEVVVPRPPALCVGCGHRDFYTALNAVIKDYPTSRVFADIGCYTLGWLAPFHAFQTTVEMGASIGMAAGASYSGVWPAVAVIGDSTFTHSGMTGLLDAVNGNADVTVCISDNLTTAMTGGQDSAGTGKLEKICEALGVAPEHIRTITPLPKYYPEMEQVFREEIEYHGVSVVISRRECIQTARRHAAAKAASKKND